MIVSTTKMTARQFAQLGEDPPGVRLELVEGEVAASPSPTPEHSHSDTALRSILHQYVRVHNLGRVFGDVDTPIDSLNVRRPDILFFSRARLHLVKAKTLEGPPDLVVEIISPSSRQIDRRDKFAQYAAAGVFYYWIVDPMERTVEAFALHAGQFVSVGSAHDQDVASLSPFDQLKIPLSEIWF